MNDIQLFSVLSEVKEEQQLSPFVDTKYLENYIKEGEARINSIVGVAVDYEKDLQARALLKTYVLYANHKSLAEFMELYQGDYLELQAKYFNTNIS